MYSLPILENSTSQNSVGNEVQTAPAGQAKSHSDFLRQIAERDPLHEMHDQERKRIWSLRYDCLHQVPHLLPKLLDCLEWNDYKEVHCYCHWYTQQQHCTKHWCWELYYAIHDAGHVCSTCYTTDTHIAPLIFMLLSHSGPKACYPT